jgi:flagellar FliJ protein
MDTFRFRLQKVLEHRQSKERETAIRMAAARREAEDALRIVNALGNVREAGREQAATAQEAGGSAGSIQQLAFILEQLGEHLAAADAASQTADEKVDRVLDEYTQAFKARRALDHLREKQLDAWYFEQAHADRKLMDALAIARHGSNGNSGGQAPESK